MKLRLVSKGLALISIMAAVPAMALSIDWSGSYRFEYVDVGSTTLAEPVNKKSYALNSLLLSPKIMAVDGFNVVSQFQILSNPNYPGAQTGQPWGLGAGDPTAAGGNANVISRTQRGSQLEVRQLYLNIVQEYGSLVVGRAPVHFGLGMTYNAGQGLFDHWGDTHDLIGYRFLIGNLSLTPMLGKVYNTDVAQGGEMSETLFMAEYNNPETESLIGFLYSERRAGMDVNDATKIFAGTKTGGWSTKSYNMILGRGFESFKFQFEVGFNDGVTGITAPGATDESKYLGYGLALEMEFPNPESKWEWNFKAGVASGDNPDTSNFEGFAFHRNYDVAFMLFNHPLGQYDLLSSQFQRQRDGTGAVYPSERALDEEVISNAAYISPSVNYRFGDHWSWRNALTYAQLHVSPQSNNPVAKDLGFEYDTALIYQPHERIQWVNEVGFLFPGGAFKGGNLNYDAKFMYGFQSKAVIRF